MIGIVGPSCDYSSSGNDLRAVFKRFGVGHDGFAGFQLLREQLERHTMFWKPLSVERYRERTGLKWEARKRESKPRAVISSNKFPLLAVQGRKWQLYATRPISISKNPPSKASSKPLQVCETANVDVLIEPIEVIVPGNMESDEVAASDGTEQDFVDSNPVHESVTIEFDRTADRMEQAFFDSNSIHGSPHPSSPPWFDSTAPSTSDFTAPSSFCSQACPMETHRSSPGPSSFQSPVSHPSPTFAFLSIPVHSARPSEAPRTPPAPLIDQSQASPSPTVAVALLQHDVPNIVRQASSLISLKNLLFYLLMARQRGRVTRHGELWKLHDTPSSHPDGYKCYNTSFNGQNIEGLMMVEIPREEGVDMMRKICILGCKKQGKHQWLSSAE
jgi:hypothetical protein